MNPDIRLWCVVRSSRGASRSFGGFQSSLDPKFDALTHLVTIVDVATYHARRYGMTNPSFDIGVSQEDPAKSWIVSVTPEVVSDDISTRIGRCVAALTWPDSPVPPVSSHILLKDAISEAIKTVKLCPVLKDCKCKIVTTT